MTAAIALAALLLVTVAAITLDSPWAVLGVAAAGVLAVVAAHVGGGRAPLPGEDAEPAADDDVRATREQLEAMLSGVADAVTAQAPDGRLLYVNDAAVRTLGFDSREALLAAAPADLLGAYEIFDEAGRPYPIAELPGRRALAGEEAPEAIVRFRVRATGEERWSAVKANPIRDGDGRVSMAINVIEDITAHKRAELAQGLLARSSDVLSGWLGSGELLTRIAQLAVPEIADWCAVDLLSPDGRLERVALTHTDPGLREHALELSRRFPPDPTTPGGAYEVVESGEPRLLQEVSDELLRRSTRSEEQYALLRELGIRSVIIVPMRTRERTLGTLTFATGPSGRRYDDHDVEVAHELARRCATAIDNNRLYSERSYIARTLQEGLLPLELPDIPGIEAAVRFRHAGDGSEVGGDFYDLFETGSRGWTVVLGDVCGKGPDAAAVTALARYTLRTAAMRHRLPSRSLSILNEALLRQRSDRRFCTVAYVYLEKVDGGARVGFASGGHPLPLLLHADGAVETIGAPGTLLGVVPDPDLEDRSLVLGRGDALVLFTDGVIEPRGSGETLDEARLAGLVARCSGREADAIAAEIEREALSAHGGLPRDDIAVLVLRVSP
jgi:serine phosphatase RsbU (regulator of sigma subunit)/PAS domain-containing protein